MVSPMGAGGSFPPTSLPEILKCIKHKWEKVPKIDHVYIKLYLTRYYNDNLLGFQRVTIVFSLLFSQDKRTMNLMNMNIN